LPDGAVNTWDINGFTSFYQAALRDGKHLDLLPTVLGPQASGGPEPLTVVVAPASASSVDTRVAPAPPADADLASALGVSGAAASDGVAPGLAVTSDDAWTGTSPAWSPAAAEADDLVLAPDGELVDLLALPALGLPLGV